MITTVLLAGAITILTAPRPPIVLPSRHQIRDLSVERMLRGQASRPAAYDIREFSRITGATLNHHIPHAMGLDIAFYDALSRRTKPPSTIVILGPNHQDIGGWPVATAHDPFDTVFGRVRINRPIVKILESKGVAHSVETLFDVEHSITSQVIPISYYFPKTTIVPIVFRSTVPTKTAEALGRTLAKILDPDAIVIASIDFSHYHAREEADRRDRRSAQLIQSLDPSIASSVDTDSKQSLAALLAFLEVRQDRAVKILERTNSSQLGGSPTYTTGYVISAMGQMK